LQLDKVAGVVGKELKQKALIALILGVIAIFFYTTWRFETAFAIGAIVALLHDVLISLGLFALLGRELSLPMVGAILAVAGYSINDTIVIFDRIREFFKGGTALNRAEVMNSAINQTLSRTLLTSGTTFLAVLILFLLGGRVINDFSLILLIGIVVGTYSSIFIASPIFWLFWCCSFLEEGSSTTSLLFSSSGLSWGRTPRSLLRVRSFCYLGESKARETC